MIQMARLLLLLTESPFQHESIDHALRIAEKALEKQHQVDIYFMMDGVYNPLKTQNGEPFKMKSVSERLDTLVEAGANIISCRVCMELRGIPEENTSNIEVGGLFDLSEMISEADTVISFTGA